ncbi:MAG: hypothetical protein J1F20_00790 [Muribaculaceae bacterium]|nr:hypothetical protein [Muribaculaceae bacterium]
MKKDKETSNPEVKRDLKPTENSYFKNGHKWLAWITGLTAAWVIITFILGLCGDVDLPQNMKYLNVWYLVNMGIIGVTACYATVCILNKCTSLIFWGGTSMYLLMLQAISLVLLFFYQQDTAAINAIAMFVWSICWYGYMVTSPAVEADLPSAHRSHAKAGEIFVGVMTLSTVAYGVMMAITLLW